MFKTFYPFYLAFCYLLIAVSVNAQTQRWYAAAVDSFPISGDQPAVFSQASAIDLDFQGNIYILDKGKHQLLKFTATGKLINQVGGFGQGEDGFDDPLDVVANTPLDVFVADYQNRRVVRFDKQLHYLSQLRSEFDPPFDFERVISLAVSSQYDLFILEDRENRVIKFSRFSQPTTAFGGMDDPFGQLLDPSDMVLDGNSRLYVADPGQQAIVIFDYLGNFVQRLTHPDFMRPRSLFYGADNHLYVTDSEAKQIFVYRQGRQFSHAIDLTTLPGEVISAVVSPRKPATPVAMNVLTSRRCYMVLVQQTP